MYIDRFSSTENRGENQKVTFPIETVRCPHTSVDDYKRGMLKHTQRQMSMLMDIDSDVDVDVGFNAAATGSETPSTLTSRGSSSGSSGGSSGGTSGSSGILSSSGSIQAKDASASASTATVVSPANANSGISSKP